MAKIMEIIAKETKGKSYHTYKYSYDSVGLPSIDKLSEADIKKCNGHNESTLASTKSILR